MTALFVGGRAARADGQPVADACRETGDHATCVAAGAAVEASSPEAALELYSVPCTKQPDQCWALIAYAERNLRKEDGPRAAQILTKGCELKSARACFALGAELEEGERGISQDLSKAAGFHRKACDLGHARACTLLALLTEDGRGVRRDARAAAKLHARAESLDKSPARPPMSPADVGSSEAQCRKNRNPKSCATTAAAIQDTDAVRAEELFRLGCTFDKDSCGLWGFAIDRFRLGDPTRAQRILEDGCTAGVALACMVFGDLYHSGFHAIGRNETRAAEFYDRACTAGEPHGCRAVAARYRGVKDAGQANEFRQKAKALDAESDKIAGAMQNAWLKEAAQKKARELYMRELARQQATWSVMASQARARWDLRAQRLMAIDAGKEPAALPDTPPAEVEESGARLGAIQRMSKTLFP